MKIALFAFRGDPLCFTHVMLNALDLEAKGHVARIIMEGEAVKLIRQLDEESSPLYRKARDKNLFDCVCKACSAKLGVLDYNAACGIPFGDDMNGHPAMEKYLDQGYEIITM